MLRLLMVVIGCAALMFGLAKAAPLPKEATESISYFPAKVGAKWVYQKDDNDYVEELTDIEQKDGVTLVTISRGANFDNLLQCYKMSISRDGVRVQSVGESAFDPPKLIIRYPVKIGDKWEDKTMISRSENKWSRLVSRIEKVKVPAGTFDAVCIEDELEEGGGKVKREFWYAPGIGAIKYVAEGKVTGVLKSFTPGKP